MPDDDQFLQAPTATKGRRKTVAKKTPEDKLRSESATVRLEGHFEIGYQLTWNFPYYQTSPAEDRGHLKRMHEKLGEETAHWLIDEFFAAVVPVAKGGDPIVSKSRHSNVRDLSYHVPHLLTRRQRGTLSDKTASNVHEIAKAMGRAK